jgi:hypothetical protein
MRLETLRRIPWPLRPIAWRISERRAHPHAERVDGSFPPVPIERPIRPVTRSEFEELASRDPYYRGRRRYFGTAAAVAGDMIVRLQLGSALELGPNVRPLIVGADVMDRIPRPDVRSTGRFVPHDATVIPWPIADRRYDLFVALQVFEHLGSGQPAAFAEVRRIARHAIISLPIDWQMDDPRNPHHGLSHDVVLSWFAPVVPTRVILGNPGNRQRLIYTFENLE